jgi:hypothetical protein
MIEAPLPPPFAPAQFGELRIRYAAPPRDGRTLDLRYGVERATAKPAGLARARRDPGLLVPEGFQAVEHVTLAIRGI